MRTQKSESRKPALALKCDEELDVAKALRELGRRQGSVDGLDLKVATIFGCEMLEDDDWGWDDFLYYYLYNPDDRPLIDIVFIHLCGWSLATLMRAAMEGVEPEKVA